MVEQYRRELDEGKSQAKQSLGLIGNKHTVDWSKYQHADWNEAVPTGVRIEQLRELGREAHDASPSNFTLHRQVARIVQDREKMTARPAAARLGLRRDAGVRDAARPKASRCASPARTAAAARSSIVTRCGTTRRRGETVHPAEESVAEPAALHGHRFAAVRRSGARLRVRLLDHRAELPDASGKRSSATSSTARRSSSTSSSARAKRSGAGCAASRCSCRTATKGRARSIRRRASSASCSCAPSTTCRCACRRRRRRCSTCCAGR